MKKTIGIMGGIAFCLLTISVNAQTEPQQPKTSPTWDAKKNLTVDSITSKYTDKFVAAKPAPTTEDIFPALGKFESVTNTDAANVFITLDEQNKGVIWVSGLPQGRIKAMLRKSPATYKIPVQKTEEGKDVAEGTLIFDKETNTLSICIGKSYNAEDPTIVFVPVASSEVAVKTKSKTAKTKKVTQPKVWMYTGTKLAKETALN